MSFQGRVGMIMWIVLIAKLMLLMMVGWEHYPNSDLSKWSPLAGPCMNISHWTAICLWLYLIAEMMILTMLVVFSIFSAGGHKGELSCKPYCQNDASGYCVALSWFLQWYKLLKKTLSSFGLMPRITLGLSCLALFGHFHRGPQNVFIDMCSFHGVWYNCHWIMCARSNPIMPLGILWTLNYFQTSWVFWVP